MTPGITADKKQRNYIVRLNKESKHIYFDSLDTKNGFKPFQNVYKPYLFSINTEEETEV